MHTWHWHTWQALPYLRCSLLAAWPHGFFTRQFAPRRPEELTTAIDATAALYWVRQVHGNVVLTPSEIAARAERPAADGVVSDAAHQAVWVATADCVPALIGDVETGQVAAVHAGWRGTAQSILPAAIAQMQAQGSRIADLRVGLGPAIAGEVYQVSTSCAATVAASILPEIDDAQMRLAELQQHPHFPLLDDPQPDRVRLDVRSVNLLQLQRLGLKAEQVAIAPFCTHRQAEFFFSHRREPLKQVQWSGIVSR